MKVDRRNLLIAGGMSLVSSIRGFARSSDAAVPPAQSEKLSSGVARLMEALHANRLPLVMSGEGTGWARWEWLVQQAQDAQFTLIGEEHGAVETARFSAALFNALRGSGYNRVAIELSPTPYLGERAPAWTQPKLLADLSIDFLSYSTPGPGFSAAYICPFVIYVIELN